eukprot:scaffold1152_cov65-Attheya_sp.AAC.4
MAIHTEPEPILDRDDEDDNPNVEPEDDLEDPSGTASHNSNNTLDDVWHQDWDDNSLNSQNNMYEYDPAPIVLRPDPAAYHSLFDAAVSEYDFMEYYSTEHFRRMQRIDCNTVGPNVPFAMAPVTLPIRGDPVCPLITYQHDTLPDPVFDHPLHIFRIDCNSVGPNVPFAMAPVTLPI